MLRSERIRKRNNRIKKDFQNYRDVYVGSVRKYRAEAIIEMLSDKYFLSPQTISDIIYSIGTYAKDRNKQN